MHSEKIDLVGVQLIQVRILSGLLKNKIMKEKLEELKQMDSEKMEDLFYELHKNDWFDDESDVISSRGSFKKGFLTAIRLIEEELNKS